MIQIYCFLTIEWILRMLRPEYSGQTGSIPWLSMPWPTTVVLIVDTQDICLPQEWISNICDISVSGNDAESQCSFYAFSEKFIARVNNRKSHSNPCKYWLPIGRDTADEGTNLSRSKEKESTCSKSLINYLNMLFRQNILSYYRFCQQTTLTTAEWPQTTLHPRSNVNVGLSTWRRTKWRFQHVCS